MAMTSRATREAVYYPVADPVTDSDMPGFVSLRQSANLEFQASVQLLAERARLLTGADSVAVALDQRGHFVYCAATGNSAPETGTTADVTRHPLAECIKTGQVARLLVERVSGGGSATASHLAVPLLQIDDDKVVGFFELAPGAIPFGDAAVESVVRLAAMAATALEHRDAAEHTESLIAEAEPEKPAPRPRPVLWHAPEAAPSQARAAESLPAPAPADIHPCTVCGFPVSGARTVCVECDAHRDDPNYDPKHGLKPYPAPDSNPAHELFTVQKQESWIEAHGYTIASLMVSALAAAIIYWLR